MTKALKITYDLNTQSYRHDRGTLRIQATEMSVREVEKGLRDLISDVEHELRTLQACPYHNKKGPPS